MSNGDIETLIELWDMPNGSDELSRDARVELSQLRSLAADAARFCGDNERLIKSVDAETVDSALENIAKLRAAVLERDRLQAEVDAQMKSIDSMRETITLARDEHSKQAAQLEYFLDLLIMHNAVDASDLGGVLDSQSRKIDAQAAQLEQARELLVNHRLIDMQGYWRNKYSAWLAANAPEGERTT